MYAAPCWSTDCLRCAQHPQGRCCSIRGCRHGKTTCEERTGSFSAPLNSVQQLRHGQQCHSHQRLKPRVGQQTVCNVLSTFRADVVAVQAAGMARRGVRSEGSNWFFQRPAEKRSAAPPWPTAPLTAAYAAPCWSPSSLQCVQLPQGRSCCATDCRHGQTTCEKRTGELALSAPR